MLETSRNMEYFLKYSTWKTPMPLADFFQGKNKVWGGHGYSIDTSTIAICALSNLSTAGTCVREVSPVLVIVGMGGE